jgi:hypothetical protein
MLTLTAAHARRVRAALKPVAALRPRGQPPPAVAFAPDGADTVARLDGGEAYAALTLPGVTLDAPLTVPWPVLAGPAGAAGFTAARKGVGVEVRWREGGADRAEVFPSSPVAPPPESPDEWADNPPDLLAALAEAAALAADHAARFALHRVQLRGGPRGQVVGTDGKALVAWGGFEFPWPGDVLVPAVRLAPDGKPAGVRVGRTDRHVVIAVGGLTAWLAIDAAGRYPEAASVIPSDGAVRAWCRLAPEALKGVSAALDRLPGGKAADAPVTLDLGTAVVLRASVEGGPPREATLAGAAVEGGPARVAFDRGHLRRACRLGLGEVGVTGPGKPVVARDGRRALVWVALDPGLAVEPAEEPPAASARTRTPARKPRTPKPRAAPAPVAEVRPEPATKAPRRRLAAGVPALVAGLVAGVAWLGRLMRDPRRRTADG